MLGSGEEPDPLIMKKVEHRGKIPYHKSTTNHNKGKISMLNKDYTAKLLNLEDAIITNVENISGEVHIFLELPRTKHPCPACGALTDRVHDYRMQTVKRTFPLAGKRCCTCVSGVIAAYAASASLRKISFSQDTTESPAGWSLRSSVRFMNWYPLQKLVHATTSLGRPQRDISNTSPLSRPNCRKCSPSTNSRATPGEKSTTALSWMLKSTKWSIFYQIALRTILSNISHNSHPKPV